MGLTSPMIANGIVAVREVSLRQANALLQEGWVLLAIIPTQEMGWSESNARNEMITNMVYVIGSKEFEER